MFYVKPHECPLKTIHLPAAQPAHSMHSEKKGTETVSLAAIFDCP